MLGDPAGLSYENRDLPIGYKSFNDRHRRQLNYIKTPKEDELGISKHTYYAIGSGLDNQEDVFLLDTIQRKENGYTVQIVEYLEDYSEGIETTNTEYNIQIKNLNDETIGTVKNTEDETNIQQIVKDNIDRFTKKVVNLKTDESGNIYVTSVQNV